MQDIQFKIFRKLSDVRYNICILLQCGRIRDLNNGETIIAICFVSLRTFIWLTSLNQFVISTQHSGQFRRSGPFSKGTIFSGDMLLVSPPEGRGAGWVRGGYDYSKCDSCMIVKL